MPSCLRSPSLVRTGGEHVVVAKRRPPSLRRLLTNTDLHRRCIRSLIPPSRRSASTANIRSSNAQDLPRPVSGVFRARGITWRRRRRARVVDRSASRCFAVRRNERRRIAGVSLRATKLFRAGAAAQCQPPDRFVGLSTGNLSGTVSGLRGLVAAPPYWRQTRGSGAVVAGLVFAPVAFGALRHQWFGTGATPRPHWGVGPDLTSIRARRPAPSASSTRRGAMVRVPGLFASGARTGTGAGGALDTSAADL